MVNDTARPADTTPENDRPLSWEKQQNQEFKTKFMVFTKRFAMGFLILLLVSLILHYSDTDIEENFGPEDYSISIESSLIFFWIILFALYLSHLVPILLLMFINKFVVQIRETRSGGEDVSPKGKEPEAPLTEEEISTAMEAAGEDEGDPGEDGKDADGGDDDREDDESDDEDDHDDDYDKDEKKDAKKKNEDVLVAPVPVDKKSLKQTEKDKEEEEKENKLALIPWFTSLRPDLPSGEGKAAEEAEMLIYSFLRYMILIIGFAYAFLTLGIDLEKDVDILGSSITAEAMLNMILIMAITIVFVLYFLPPFLSIILNAALRGYAKRNATREDRLREMRNEVDKIRTGLYKTIVFLIVLGAALGAMDYVDCSVGTHTETETSWVHNEGGESTEVVTTREVKDNQTQLCEYLESAQLVTSCLMILVTALLLTTITPLFIYMFSKSPGDIRKTNLYKAGVYINYLILIFAFFIILNFVGLDLSASIAFGSNTITLWDIISAVVIVILSNIIAKLVTAILRDTALNPKQMEEHASILMEKLIHIVIVAIGFGIAMSILGINVMAISLATGLIGFALAFGMQDTIANIIGGIVLAMEKPFKIGDRIRVGNDWGDVIDIGMRSTKIRTVKNETVVIPNSLVVTNEVWNYTKESPVLANVIPIGISYDSDPVLAEEIILEIAREHPLVIDSPPASVRLVNYGDSSVDLELWAWIGNARKREVVKSDLLKSIKQEFNKEEVGIPFPHRTLLFKDESGKDKVKKLKGK